MRVIFSHFPFVRILPPPPPAFGPAGRGGSGVPGAAEAVISVIPIKVKKMAVHNSVHTFGRRREFLLSSCYYTISPLALLRYD